MTNKNKWIDLALLGICTVALTGFVLRSKIVFELPFVNYNNLLEGHSHFAFGGWVTLALAALMINELLPGYYNKKPVYQWLLGCMAAGAWGTLIAFILEGYGMLSIIVSAFFICVTYIFTFIFIRDLLRQKPATPVLLLAISSLVFLVLSSAGPFVIMRIFFSKAFDAILYRDALFTYLHFQYNGFFSVAIFALLVNHAGQNISTGTKKSIFRFSVALCVSIIPSLFLSYLWQDPNQWLRIIAIAGCILLLLTLALLIAASRPLITVYRGESFVIKLLVLLSLGSFMLKLFLQSFTILPDIGNAIFGNRPVIMGFLHLVFLGFISPFILAHLTKKGLLNQAKKITRAALIVFAAGVVINESLLITQGLVTMFMPGSNIFPWLLWLAGIWLFTGTVLIAIARIRSRQ